MPDAARTFAAQACARQRTKEKVSPLQSLKAGDKEVVLFCSRNGSARPLTDV
jgi:hypothetical protein